MRLFIVDAFTSKPFAGNQAGVVIQNSNENVSAALMQALAAELHYSETAFVKESQDKAVNFDIRFFTPVSEIEVCGHATIAAFSALKYLGSLKDGETYKLRTKTAILDVKLENDIVTVELGAPQCDADSFKCEIPHVAKMLGISPADIGDSRVDLAPMPVSTGLLDLIIPLKSKKALLALAPDYEEIAKYCKAYNLVGFHVFTLDEERALANCRNFAPLYGILEEAATGTANASLAYYLYIFKVIQNNEIYKILQGESLNRPSEIYVEISSNETSCKAYIGGKAAIIAEGNLKI